MKNIKIILQSVALVLLLASCSKEDSVLDTKNNSQSIDANSTTFTYKVLDAASVPVSISKTIALGYPSGTIAEVSLLSTGDYTALILTNVTSKGGGESRTKVNFSSRGIFKSATTQTAIAIANLPATITTYITTNYVDATINSAHIESDGRYDVVITTATGVVTKVYFTSAGIFISSSTSTKTGSHTSIEVSSLLVDITNYISTNYSGATITSAYTDTDGSFDVYITTNVGTTIKLDFTMAGVFVSANSSGSSSSNHTHTTVAISNLPATISIYITTNYVGATITLAYLETDGTYDVYITTATGTGIKLDFTAEGTFVAANSNGSHARRKGH